MKDQVTWRSSTHLLLSGCTAGNDHNWTSGPVLHTEQWRDPALEGMTTTTNRHGGFTSHISCKRLATFRETMLYTCSGRYIRPAISIFRVLTYSLTYLVTYLLTHLLTYLLTFPCFFLSCKANARVKLAKTGHGPHSSILVVICVVRLLFVLFYVLFVYKCVLPPGDNPTAVNK